MWKYLVVLGIAGYYLYGRAIDVYNKIKYEFTGLRLSDINPFSSTIKLKYKVKNENSWPITIDRFVGQITQNRILLSDIQVNSAVVLTPNEEKELVIEAPVKNANLLYRIEEILRDGWEALEPIEIAGTLTINGVALPVKSTVKILDY